MEKNPKLLREGLKDATRLYCVSFVNSALTVVQRSLHVYSHGNILALLELARALQGTSGRHSRISNLLNRMLRVSPCGTQTSTLYMHVD